MKSENTRLKVRILKADIKNGVRDDANSCAVSRACERELAPKLALDKNTLIVSVDYSRLSMTTKAWRLCMGDANNDIEITLPKKVVRFAERFDRDKKLVAPMEFTLIVPKSLLKQ